MSTAIIAPRGRANLPPLTLEMKRIYAAEERLKEVAFVNPNTSQELSAFFNEMCNETTKYEAWVEYEILEAQRVVDETKAAIIIDRIPELAAQLKDSGQKPNEQWREAVIVSDKNYQQALNVLNALRAVKALLHAKSKSFERAYYSTRDISRVRDKVGATPNVSGVIGQLSEPQANFMGITQLK